MAVHAVQREQNQYRKIHSQPVRRPGSTAGNMKKPARPVKPAKPVPAVKKSAVQVKKTVKPAHPAMKNLVEREKNRLRVLLLEQQRKGHPAVLPSLHLKRDELSVEQQTAFSRWLRGLKAVVEAAARMHQAVYHSHQSLAGFHFTVPTPEGDTRMELKSILRDEVILFRQGMENVRLKFNQLPSAEWLDFLRYAAKKKDLNRDLDSYLLLNGWFAPVAKSGNAFVRQEMPFFRKVYYRYLTGEKIAGVAPLKEDIEKEIIRKYSWDPFFAPFRSKLEQRKRTGDKKDRPEGGQK